MFCQQRMSSEPTVPPRQVPHKDTAGVGPLRRVLQKLKSDVNASPRAQTHPLQLVLCIFPGPSPALYGGSVLCSRPRTVLTVFKPFRWASIRMEFLVMGEAAQGPFIA